MGRVAGTPQWQLIEVAAAFKAGEAANDAKQVSSATARNFRAATEYALWLRRFNSDPTWVSKGEQFAEKILKNKPQFTLEDSILQRKIAVLKKHKEVLAYCRKVIMPAFFGFFTALGKPPSGTQVQDAQKDVLKAIWSNQEEERIKKVQCKQEKGGLYDPVDLVTSADDLVTTEEVCLQADIAATSASLLPMKSVEEGGLVAEVTNISGTNTELENSAAQAPLQVEVEGAEDEDVHNLKSNNAANNTDGESKSLVMRDMPCDYTGPKEYTIWCMFGPLAPQDDQTESLTGPGETDGKPRHLTSRAAQRGAVQQKRSSMESSSDNLSDISGARDLSPPELHKNFTNSNYLNESLMEVKRMRTAIEKSQQQESLKQLYELEDDPEKKSLIKVQLMESYRALSSFQE
ncbi:hypothetical protein AB1Y20_001330 [Prymnesium parvum]|uniref:Uncharacterized protein n=1 Tax=Prymnesium parvum TaxID=97485 RepID=A0AB34KD93_PRYPA